MNASAAKKNVIASLAYQLVTIIYGLVVPRIILTSFGSEVNGLVSSLSQFLNYISLLEGGLTGVIMAALYRPLANKDYVKVSGVIKAANSFFKRIAVIFVVYTLILAAAYPLVVKTPFTWGYVFSLTIIISLSLFIQYFFALSYRILINADQKGYVVYLTLMLFTAVNFVFTILVVNVWKEIHVLKLMSAVAFLIQPIVFSYYVNKHYPLDKTVQLDKEALSQRWDGFGQNIAFFIHSNTDVVVLTLFSTLANVSVYSVYMLVISALKTLVSAISSSLAPSLGNSLATMSNEEANDMFDNYEFGMSFITTFAFTCGALLITPFVQIYTRGVTDANYYQPMFGYLMMAAEAVYCFRDPYVNVAYVSGKFRETAVYAYIEAGLNILISAVLVSKFGLIGVAIGTLIAMIFRMVSHMVYLNNNLIKRPLQSSLKCVGVFLSDVLICSVLVKALVRFTANNYFDWVWQAVMTASVVLITMLAISCVFYKKCLSNLIGTFLKKK